MATVGFILTEQDRDVIRELLDWWRHQKAIPTRPRREPDELSSSQCYLAFTPQSGISALAVGGLSGTGTGVLLDDVPGSASCPIYRIYKPDDGDAEIRPIQGLRKTVYNVGPTAIAGNTWIPIVKDKSGSWLCNPRSSSDTSIGSGYVLGWSFVLTDEITPFLDGGYYALDTPDTISFTLTEDTVIELDAWVISYWDPGSDFESSIKLRVNGVEVPGSFVFVYGDLVNGREFQIRSRVITTLTAGANTCEIRFGAGSSGFGDVQHWHTRSLTATIME